ncbi:MAG: adenine phosphoribosyltransferase [Spirochaetaceae bacterium 4572_7]|nr:MAG: adenine phosphoribosyltransferase [Spirochaetaceae bacterium 4572_7]
MNFDLDSAVKKIPNFPKDGVLFYDITGILMNPDAFNYVISKMVDLYKGQNFTSIACVESRGFIFGAPLAKELGLPIVLVRKAGKLPGDLYKRSYKLEYGEAVIEVQKSDIQRGDKVLLIDDLLATGGTLQAAHHMFHEAGADVTDIFAVIGLPFLNYKDKFKGINVTTLIDYNNEHI